MAYCRPLRGVDGAGDGGKSWPSRSTFVKALVIAESLGFGSGVDEEPESDISRGLNRGGGGWRNKLNDLQRRY
jgi:hypothetical protein